MNPSKFEEQSKDFLFNVFNRFDNKDWELLIGDLMFGISFKEACDSSKLYEIFSNVLSVNQYYKVKPFLLTVKNNLFKEIEFKPETEEIIPRKNFEEQCKKFETSLKEIINDSWNDIKHFYHIDNQGYFDNNFNWYPNKELIPDDHISDSEKESYENFEKNSLISVTDLVFSKSNSYYLISYV